MPSLRDPPRHSSPAGVRDRTSSKAPLETGGPEISVPPNMRGFTLLRTFHSRPSPHPPCSTTTAAELFFLFHQRSCAASTQGATGGSLPSLSLVTPSWLLGLRDGLGLATHTAYQAGRLLAAILRRLLRITVDSPLGALLVIQTSHLSPSTCPFRAGLTLYCLLGAMQGAHFPPRPCRVLSALVTGALTTHFPIAARGLWICAAWTVPAFPLQPDGARVSLVPVTPQLAARLLGIGPP